MMVAKLGQCDVKLLQAAVALIRQPMHPPMPPHASSRACATASMQTDHADTAVRQCAAEGTCQ